MQLIPYLNFNGQCEAAFKFYEQCLGGKIVTMMSYGDSPMAKDVPPAWHTITMHASLAIGDTPVLMGSDRPPDKHEETKGACVSIHMDDAAKGERIFKALAEGGTVQMPFTETFWAEGFGMLVDRFGTPWMINCGRAA
jgi:PhnB protein